MFRKIKPLNENPKQVLKLLNEYKHNLTRLVQQYPNIIELYLKILRIDYRENSPNVQQVVFPEIEQLLKDKPDTIEFRKTGIYRESELIFNRVEGKLSKIQIQDGKNSSILLLDILGIGYRREILEQKVIQDFSKLTQREKQLLSKEACEQLEKPQEENSIKLTKIEMDTVSGGGVELTKDIYEYYGEIKIHTKFSCNVDKPIMDFKRETIIPEALKGKVAIEEYQQTAQYYHYGDYKFSLPEEEAQPNGANYDCDRLLKNFQNYQRRFGQCGDKYPHKHPFFTTHSKESWKGDFGERVHEYIEPSKDTLQKE